MDCQIETEETIQVKKLKKLLLADILVQDNFHDFLR